MNKEKNSGQRKIKKARYKPLSKKQKAKKASNAKLLKLAAMNESRESPEMIFEKSDSKRSQYSSFFLNNLKPFSKDSRKRHFKNINDIFEWNHEGEVSKKWNFALICTFVYSDIFLKKLRETCRKTVIICDSLKCKSEVEKVISDEDLMLFHSASEFGSSIPSNFHPKIFLLGNDRFLRVVVGSGNFNFTGWNIFANIFWCEDFPILKQVTLEKSEFNTYLEYFLSKCFDSFWDEVKGFLTINFHIYDLKSTYCRLIGSLPTKLCNSAHFKFNLQRLEQILHERLPKDTFSLHRTRIIYYSSSLGSCDLIFLYNFAKTVLKDAAPSHENVFQEKESILRAFEVVYPTENYVKGTHWGESGGQCLFLKKNNYDRFKFEKSILRRFEGLECVDGGKVITPHIKVILIINNDEINDQTVIYIGSHNFTKAAWGGYDFKGSNNQGFNYEMGIIIPPQKGSKKSKLNFLDRFGLSVNNKPYRSSDKPFLTNDSNARNNS